MLLWKSFLILIFYCTFSAQLALAQKKAKVIQPGTDVYQEADFDSGIIRTVEPTESFVISNKPYGPFYKVKFKDGVIGFIPDTELNIEGVGPFKPKAYVEDEELNGGKKSKDKSTTGDVEDQYDEDTESPQLAYKGVTLQMVNYHEDTMSGIQVADLLAVGFRYQPMAGNFDSALSYELLIAPKAPEYYSSKTKGSATGGVFWGSAQISNTTGMGAKSSIRYGAGPFLKYSYFSVDTPDKKYALQDMTVGLDVQAGVMLHTRYVTLDFGLRYFWDKQPYGGFGVTFLF